MNLLIIDDDEVDRLAIIRAMKKNAGYITISQADCARTGVEMAETEKFDAILLDYRLPDSNGMNVIRRLRSGNHPSTAIIMISQHEDMTIANEAIDKGAQDFLLKSEVTAIRLARAIRVAQQRKHIELELEASQNQLRQLADFDVLTGIRNRRSFEQSMNSAVDRAKRSQEPLAILLLDLDKFKDINDTLGHQAGDALLVEVARRLDEAVRDSDILARLGGDEFIVLAQNMIRNDQVVLLAERILDSLTSPLTLEGTDLHISASIGIAVYGTDAADYSELVKCADMAMYRAKQEGRNCYHFYSEKLHRGVLERISIENKIRQALPLGQFKLCYQAQIRASDNQLFGVEALLRWQHPELGLLLPEKFLAIAESTGIMPRLGEWVLKTACQQVRIWQDQFPGLVKRLAVSVNLSAKQLEDKNFVSNVEKIVSDTRIEPSCLDLEVTENTFIRNPQQAASILSELANYGISISLDDFGTGYSSFQHLLLFPITALKIDKTFISMIGKSVEAERLLTAMINFAEGLEIEVVAEGIETTEQDLFCRQHNCDFLQGYYYSEALPANDFEIKYLSSSGH